MGSYKHGCISRLTIFSPHIRGLVIMTLFITTHEPPSNPQPGLSEAAQGSCWPRAARTLLPAASASPGFDDSMCGSLAVVQLEGNDGLGV